MKKIDLQVVIMLVVFTVTTTVIAVLGQNAKYTVEDDFSLLTLDLTTNKQNILPFEPLLVNLKLENTTSKSIRGHSKLDFSRKFVEFLVTDQEGNPIRIPGRSPVTCKCTLPEQISIQPGQRFEKEEVFYNFHEAFSKPGIYKIQAVLKNLERDAEIKSNQVSIRIIELSSLEKDAYNFLKDKVKRNKFFFAGVGESDAYDKLEILFPGTLYSDYASYFVGIRYLEQKQYVEAKGHFNRISKREGFVFDDDLRKEENKLKEQ